MSKFNSDHDVVNDGRKNKLKDVKLPLRDQIVKDLANKLEEKEIGSKVTDAWNLSTANIAGLLERQQVFLKDLDENIPASAEAPFAGSSNLHLPMPFIVSKTYHARFMAAILGVDPPFSVKARREDGVDKVNMIEDIMHYALKDWANCYRGVDESVDTWIWNWVTTGTGVLKIRWQTEYIRYVDVESAIVPTTPSIRINEQGEEELVPNMEVKESEVKVTHPKFKGPMVEWVNLEDFRMVGGNGDPDLADIVMQRSFLTASDLWTAVDQGYFDSEAVEKIIQSGPDHRSAETGSAIKQQRALNAGKGSAETEAELDRYTIIESYLKMDVDGSGINSDVVVWTHLQSRAILRATYLHRVIPSGERPFSVIHFHKRPGEEYGVGLLEILHPLSVELDVMHNMRIDWGMISNMPYFFYRASSSLDPETFQLEPGVGIPVDNPATDVYFPQIGNRTVFGAQEEQSIQTYIERLTGLSDLSFGSMTGSQGAARTASGVRALIGESNANLDVHLRRLNRGWKKVLRTLFHLIQNRVEPGFVFRVTGSDGSDYFRQVYPRDLQQEIDFDLSPNSANSNKAVQTEVAQQLVQITSNPLYIQLGLSGPNQVYNALRNYLSQLGIKDIHRYISKPSPQTFTLTPEEEFNRVVRGQEVRVTPEMDHDGAMAFFTTMIQAQQQVQTLDQQQVQLLIAQLRKHEDMKAAMDAQAKQLAVQQQMVANSQMGAPQLSNPVAGSTPGQLPGPQ